MQILSREALSHARDYANRYCLMAVALELMKTPEMNLVTWMM